MEPITAPDRLVGKLVINKKTGIQYRVVRKNNNHYECVVTNTNKLEINIFDAEKFWNECVMGRYEIAIEHPEFAFSVDISEAQDCELRRDVINAIKEALGGNLLAVEDIRNYKTITDVCDAYGVEWVSIEPWLIRYIQSGEQDYALRMKKNLRRPIRFRYRLPKAMPIISNKEE